MSYYRTIDDVVDAVIRANESDININFLIGAGCSVSSNIPTAAGIIDEIKKQYPGEYERTEIKTYANCMLKLTARERRQLIIDIVNRANINWAHVALAQLMKCDFVNRILTTNFDNLIQRACALVVEFPAMYDLATSTAFRSDLLFQKSVLHLHGQHTGFILCNTESEVVDQAKKLRNIFNELNSDSMWIIIGYSGENDAIFELLKEETIYDNRLFIVGYNNNKPTVKYKELLDEEKYAFYVKGFNADDFLVTLAQKLKCFPPEFVSMPFSYLNSLVQNIVPYTILSTHDLEKIGTEEGDTLEYRINSDITEATKKVIAKAIKDVEKDEELMANHYYSAGLHSDVIDNYYESNNTKVRHLVALSLNQLKKYDDAQQIIETIDFTEFPPNLNKDIEIAKIKTNKAYEITDEADVRKIIIETSTHYFKGVQKLENSMFDVAMVQWILFLSYGIIKISKSRNEIDTELIEHINFIIDQKSKEESDKADSVMFMFKRNLAYELIDAGRLFELSKIILDKMYQTHPEDPFIAANIGFWFFRNEKIAEGEAWENGQKFYEIAKDSAADDMNLIMGLEQKKLTEMSRFFLVKGRMYEAKEYINQAIRYGEVKDYPNVLLEASEILEDILQRMEAASTEEAMLVEDGNKKND